MLTHATTENLKKLRLFSMVKALEDQFNQPQIERLSFEDCLGLIVDREIRRLQKTYPNFSLCFST